MATDREVLREVWEGKIPLCITIASGELNAIDEVESIYMMAPRCSYLPLCCERVAEVCRKSQSASADESADSPEVWFEYNGVPLKWHLPIGVLFDLHSDQHSLPWQLTAHCSNFPEGEIMRCQSNDVVEAHFMSRLKEADYLKHGGDVITAMQRPDHQALWSGVKSNKFEQFWEVNRKLMNSGAFRNIPFYIHQRERPVTQRLFQPQVSDDNTSARTLKQLLDCALPDLDLSTSRVLLQGFEPPLDTPVQWLSEHLSYPDNFLHFVVRDRS